MADKNVDYYAWSRFHLVNEKGETVKIKPGDRVTASKLMVPDEEFDAYIESGAVRKTKFPKMPEGYGGSPREFRLAQIAAEAAGEDFEASMASLPVEKEVDK